MILKIFEGYYYSVWSENEEKSSDKEEFKELSSVPPLEGNEDVK